MKTYNITTETADLIRAAAPALGLAANGAREFIAPGIEALHMHPIAAVKFDTMRKAAKVSPDVLIRRILKKKGN